MKFKFISYNQPELHDAWTKYQEAVLPFTNRVAGDYKQ